MKNSRLSNIFGELDDLKTIIYSIWFMLVFVVFLAIVFIILLFVGFIVNNEKINDLEDEQESIQKIVENFNGTNTSLENLILQVNNNTIDISDLLSRVRNNEIDIYELQIELNNLNISLTDLRTDFDVLVNNFAAMVRDSLGRVVYASESTGSDSNTGGLLDPVQTFGKAISLAKQDVFSQIVLFSGNYTLDKDLNDQQAGLQSLKVTGTRVPIAFFTCVDFTSSLREGEFSPFIIGVVTDYDTICSVSGSILVPGQFNGMLANTPISGDIFILENTNDTVTFIGSEFGGLSPTFIRVFELSSVINIPFKEQIQVPSGIFFRDLLFSGPELTTEGPISTSISFERCKLDLNILSIVNSPSVKMDVVYTDTADRIIIDTAGEGDLNKVGFLDTQVLFVKTTLSATNLYMTSSTNALQITQGANVVMDGFYALNRNGIDVRDSQLQIISGVSELTRCTSGIIGPFHAGNSLVTLGAIGNNPGLNVINCLGGPGGHSALNIIGSEFDFYGNLVTKVVLTNGVAIESSASRINIRGTLIPTGLFSQLLLASTSEISVEVNREIIVESSVIDPASTKAVIELIQCDLISSALASSFRLILQGVPRGISISSGRLYWRSGLVNITTADGFALRLTDQAFGTFDPIINPIILHSSSSTEPTVIIEDSSSLNLKGKNYNLGSFGGQPCIKLNNFAEVNYKSPGNPGIDFDCDVYEIEARYMSNVNVVRPAFISLAPTSVNSTRIGSLVNDTTLLLSFPDSVITDGNGIGVENCHLVLQ